MERSGSSSKSPSARSRDEQRRAARAGKIDSKKDESKKDKAAEAAKVAEEAAKNNSTPAGKRKSGEVISPLGLTPKNKTTNTGTFIFDTLNAQFSHKSVGYNNLTNQGKAVFNNKEY